MSNSELIDQEVRIRTLEKLAMDIDYRLCRMEDKMFSQFMIVFSLIITTIVLQFTNGWS